jgi:TetR/AcrR family transcriptional repressor of nem operon
MESSATALEIIDAAQELAQTRGYNGFSYKDIAERVGIRTASIHYHFPSKGDLGVAMLDRYRRFVAAAAADIDVVIGETEKKTGDGASERLRRYAGILDKVLNTGNRMCLGGMLASDYETLPPEVQREVTRFVAENERWLARVLTEGKKAGALSFAGTPEAAASALFAALEGAMLTARSCGDPTRYTHAAAWIINGLTAKQKSARAR